MTAPLGICPGCEGRTPLRRISGKVRWHDVIHPMVVLSGDLVLPGGVERCPGSGKAPKVRSNIRIVPLAHCAYCWRAKPLSRSPRYVGLVRWHVFVAWPGLTGCPGTHKTPAGGASL